MYQSTCTPVQNDVCIAYGENHDFVLNFKTDRDLSAATCTITFRKNNSSDTVLITEHKPIVNNSVAFSITPAQSRTLGAGTFYYDIWMMDGATFEKPIVEGTLTVMALTTRVQP